MLEDHITRKGRDEPFFLYLALQSIHDPFQVEAYYNIWFDLSLGYFFYFLTGPGAFSHLVRLASSFRRLGENSQDEEDNTWLEMLQIKARQTVGLFWGFWFSCMETKKGEENFSKKSLEFGGW